MLHAPSLGFLTRFPELLFIKLGSYGSQVVAHVLATVGRDQKPHVRQLRIGFHTRTDAEHVGQVDGCFHVAVLCRQKEKSERAGRVLWNTASGLIHGGKVVLSTGVAMPGGLLIPLRSSRQILRQLPS